MNKKNKIVINTLIIILSFLLLSGCDPRFRGSNLIRQNTILKKENKNLQGRINSLTERISNLERKMSLLRKNNYSLLFTGDILLDNELTDYMKKEGPDYPFRRIHKQLEGYDVVFGNLETPISKTGVPVRNKPYVFALDPAYKSVLKSVKLDVVSLANNHILDYGVDGMRETIKNLDSIGIHYSGAGEDLKEARKPVVFQLGTTEVMIFSYCRRPPAHFFAGKNNAGTAPLYLKFIKEDISRYKHTDAIIIVSLHWGIEQTSQPQRYQQLLARAIINAGADAIIGHHPHWPQGIEIYKKRPIVYSLGNFVNGYYNKVEKDNIFTVLHFRRTKLQKMEILPIAGKNREMFFQPYIMAGEAAAKHMKSIQRLSARLRTRLKIEKGRGVIRF